MGRRNRTAIFLGRTPIYRRWASEERDFTPWVQDQARSRFRDLLGCEVEVVGREQQIGGFEIDLVLRRRDNSELVVVENLLDHLDHAHIGKALTYAMLLPATTIIWVVGGVRDSHLRALQRLAEQLNGVELYVLEVSIPFGEANGGYEVEPTIVERLASNRTEEP